MRKRTKRIDINIENLKELYTNEKKNMYQCAEILGCSVHTINNRLKENDIRIRDFSESTTGKKLTKEHIEKIRLTSTGRKHSKETKIKMSLSGKGKKKPIGFGENQKGENNPNWTGGFNESWFNDPIINKCYSITRSAKRKNQIIKQPCEICGNKNVHGHHDDYKLPLKLRWLCPKHHQYFHREHILENYKYKPINKVIGNQSEGDIYD